MSCYHLLIPSVPKSDNGLALHILAEFINDAIRQPKLLGDLVCLSLDEDNRKTIKDFFVRSLIQAGRRRE